MKSSGAEARVQKSDVNGRIFENYFESNYPPLPLPMIWRVVYHEAIRGNHILWSQESLKEVGSMYQEPSFQVEESDKIAITKFMATFISTNDFQTLKQMIEGLTTKHKALVFVLYKRHVSLWRDWLKRNLN